MKLLGYEIKNCKKCRENNLQISGLSGVAFAMKVEMAKIFGLTLHEIYNDIKDNVAIFDETKNKFKAVLGGLDEARLL